MSQSAKTPQKKIPKNLLISTDKDWVAVIGNPNCGKTALFNELTGMHQRVGNYPGITVELKTGTLTLENGKHLEIYDLPGTYSLSPQSIDEEVVTDIIHESFLFDRLPTAFIVVLDSTNLERNLFLAGQILELGIPTIISLNMIDLLHKKKQDLNVDKLGVSLGTKYVIPTIAKKGKGVREIKLALNDILTKPAEVNPIQLWEKPGIFYEAAQPIADWIKTRKIFPEDLLDSLLLRLGSNVESKRRFVRNLYRYQTELNLKDSEIEDLKHMFRDMRHFIQRAGYSPQSLEARLRYQRSDKILDEVLIKSDIIYKEKSVRLDQIMTHKFWGIAIFLFIMGGIFQAVFSLADIPMGYIDDFFSAFGVWTSTNLPPGVLRDLLVEGIIGGVGSVLVFLPQILILVFLLGLLEDTGYMARVAFLMDKLFSKLGLSGRSVVPLLNGYACAVPAIMSTRTIKNWDDRLITILIIPLMSCSARLPLYTLLVAAFIPNMLVWGFLPLQGLTLFTLYFLGTLTAGIVAYILKKFVVKSKETSFIMELPPYRVPHMRSIFWQVYDKGKSFVITAGQIILAISIVLWFLAAFPKDDQGKSNIETSYAAQFGKTIEPVIKPLGFNWKIGVGLITSFAAREVIISTLTTIYNVDDSSNESLTERLKKEIDPKTGKPVYSLLTVFSLLIFYVFAAQCMATFAIIKKETNSWKWPIFSIAYMTVLAYLGSLIVYQVGGVIFNG